MLLFSIIISMVCVLSASSGEVGHPPPGVLMVLPLGQDGTTPASESHCVGIWMGRLDLTEVSLASLPVLPEKLEIGNIIKAPKRCVLGEFQGFPEMFLMVRRRRNCTSDPAKPTYCPIVFGITSSPPAREEADTCYHIYTGNLQMPGSSTSTHILNVFWVRRTCDTTDIDNFLIENTLLPLSEEINGEASKLPEEDGEPWIVLKWNLWPDQSVDCVKVFATGLAVGLLVYMLILYCDYARGR